MNRDEMRAAQQRAHLMKHILAGANGPDDSDPDIVVEIEVVGNPPTKLLPQPKKKTGCLDDYFGWFPNDDVLDLDAEMAEEDKPKPFYLQKGESWKRKKKRGRHG